MVFFKEIPFLVLLFLVSQVSSCYIQGCYLSNSTIPEQQHFDDFKLETYTPGLCSHIVFSYSNIKDDFIMDHLNPGQLKWGGGNKFYNQLNGIKSQQPELKTILSLGGTCDFKDMLSDEEKRQMFVKSAADFVKQFNFDGVDIDATQSVINKNDLTKLIKEFKIEIPGKLITISVSTDQENFGSNFDVPTIAKFTDFVNILTPQNDVKQSASITAQDAKSSNTFDTMYDWVSNGMSKNKLIVGMNILGNSKNANAALNATVNSFEASVNVKNKWMKENGFGGACLRSFDHTISDGQCLSEASMNQADPFCCFPVADTDIPNNDLSATTGAANECCAICAGLGGCVAFVWDNYFGGTCHFKTVAGPGVTKIGSIAGIPCDAQKKADQFCPLRESVITMAVAGKGKKFDL